MTTLRELLDMTGRRALVTGATGHLGSVIVDTLAELGAEIVLVDRPDSDFAAIEGKLRDKWGARCHTISCDLEAEAERVSLIAAVKADAAGLDVLVNNAAFVGTSDLQGWSAPFELQTLATWRRAIEVNLTAAFHLCQSFAPDLASRGGNIINITSIYGEYGPDWRMYEGTPMANPAAYGASKGGLAQLTRWLATTLAPRIRVNAISPGGIFRNQPDAFVQRYASRTPLGRMANEDDFRGAVAFLASQSARYVTGQVLRIDGGWGEW